MKYEFDLYTERAETLKREFGEGCELSKADRDGFIRISVEIESNWDALKFFHAGIAAGRESMIADGAHF